MSPPPRKTLRIIVGFFGGLFGGVVLGIGLAILLFVVCLAAGGGYNRPNEATLVPMFLYADYAIAILFPLAGTILGVIWAIRRNRRDEANSS
jgi:hypothetical protein